MLIISSLDANDRKLLFRNCFLFSFGRFLWVIYIGVIKGIKKLAQMLLFGTFYPLLKNESNKSLSTREIIGLVSISLAVLVIGIFAITEVIDGSYKRTLI